LLDDRQVAQTFLRIVFFHVSPKCWADDPAALPLDGLDRDQEEFAAGCGPLPRGSLPTAGTARGVPKSPELVNHR
jgi:hypothetical protein